MHTLAPINILDQTAKNVDTLTENMMETRKTNKIDEKNKKGGQRW